MRIGIVGGGQLARMLALAGIPLGIRFSVYDPAPDACAGVVADLIQGDFDDLGALKAFARQCDLVTFDFENVSAPGLVELASRCPVFPPPLALSTSQDRLKEKALFAMLGVPVAPHCAVPGEVPGDFRFPAILKTTRFGYDGKGQVTVATRQVLTQAHAALHEAACVLESKVPFDRELSIIAVRGTDGEVRCYPLTENVHAGGVLAVSIAPARVSAAQQRHAEAIAHRLADALEYVGVFAIEFFDVDGQLVANEMAPRVHNSGHWTIEGAVTSQFQNHIRAIAGLPLGDCAALGYSCMLNWVGSLPDRSAALRTPGAHWHDYGKQARSGRKVGHVTLTHQSCRALLEILEARSTTGLAGPPVELAKGLLHNYLQR